MKRVLIVDDSKQIRERVAALLAGSDQIRIVGEAGDGYQAMRVIPQLKPDTIILDIRLPKRSGIEMLKEVKVLYPKIRVIMLTNYDYDLYRQQCKRLGADHFLNKTLEFEKIMATILEDSSY
jgi:DNA-binding NarL/FixJ family response regulator